MMKVRNVPRLKRIIVGCAVVALVGTAAVMNWSYNRKWGEADSAMAKAEDAMSAQSSIIEDMDLAVLAEEEESVYTSSYFAEARLTRQQSRDQALALLESAACADSASQEVIDSAMNDITVMANWSLMESKIENELLAKDFVDCVVYLGENTCTVAVPAPKDGLTAEDVAKVTDSIVTNTGLSAAQINVIEVKNY